MELTIRHIGADEYGEAKRVWDICFPEDASGYSDYYFARRTRPEYVLAAFYEGKMIAALHAIPYPIMLGGKTKNCVMIAGVATLPEYRHHMAAARLITACHAEQKQKGTAAAILKPDVNFYAQFGYIPFAWHDEYRLPWIDAGIPAPIHETTAEEMLKIYSAFSADYIGMMARTEQDMENYIEEARVTGGFAYSDGKAYALLNETDGGANVYELVGTDTAGLLSSIAEEFGALTFRLPRDTMPSIPAMRIGEIMFSMICPLNEDILLKNTGAQSAEELAGGGYGRVCTLEFC